jgi:ligand-binding sensor domain-containing protein
MCQEFPGLRFSHLGEREGLSNNLVSAIAQDHDGIIWIGTNNGLNRFDGYGVTSFYSSPDGKGAIPHSYITSIVADSSNNLWVSSSEGLFYFNTRTRQCRDFSRPRNSGNSAGTAGNPGNGNAGMTAVDSGGFRDPHRPAIYLDSTQLPWITTFEGLYHFRDSMHYVRMDEGVDILKGVVSGAGANRKAAFSRLVRDRKGGLWSCWGHYIFKLDNRTKKLSKLFQGPDQLLIRCIFFDSYNRCWVGTWGNCVYRFSPEDNGWESFAPSKGNIVIYGAAEWEIYGRKIMVFTCGTPGLLFVDEQDLSTYTYPFDANVATMVGPPFIDRQNILWVPTTDGVYYTAPSNYLFRVISVPPLKSAEGKSMISYVYNMREEKSGYWLAKRYNGGVYWYDKDWRLVKSWLWIPVDFGSKFPALGRQAREAFDFRQVGEELYMTTEAGISILDLHDFQWKTCGPTGLRSPPRLRNILVENDRRWWIRSFDQGVFLFDPVSRSFLRQYKNDPTCDSCMPGDINYLLRDKKGRVFASTNGGLFEYQPARDGFVKSTMQGKFLPGNIMYGMAEDTNGLLWIGSENGVYGFNPANNSIEETIPDENKIGVVFRVCLDEGQNVWFCSASGYWCWLRKQGKLIHFEYGLGLPKTGDGIFYETADGSVYGGGLDAVVRFYPEQIMKYKVAARTCIMEALVNDRIVPFTIDRNGQKQLQLSADQNSLVVDFDVINYDLASTNQYYYKLSPGDNDWKQSENGKLNFYNLQPGKYRLEVKGASKLSDRSTNIDSLDMVIQPYWYQSSWFKMICLAVAGFIIYYAVRRRIELIRKDAAFRQRIAEVEMTALRAQMNPHFIFNSLNSVENFIMQNEKRLASDYLNKFARLIRLILENSRKEAVTLARDMESLQLYVDLEQLRFNNKFRYITDIDKALLEGDYSVPPLLIQPFVENAIVHGLAPSEKNGLFLRVSIRLEEDQIKYTIEDNGIGRAQSMAYTERNRPSHKSLGLDITRERIGIMNRRHGREATLEFVDLQDEKLEAAGTLVILTIRVS